MLKSWAASGRSMGGLLHGCLLAACSFQAPGGNGAGAATDDGDTSSGASSTGSTGGSGSVTSASASASASVSASGGGDVTGAPTADCCTRHRSAGCGDPTVEACVCDQDASCCAFEWAERCVTLAAGGCTVCSDVPPPNDTTSGGPDGGSTGDGGGDMGGNPVDAGNCCWPHFQTGCDAPAVQECVCSQDAYCCASHWDGQCVDAVPGCGGTCESGDGDGGGDGGGGSSTCCMQHGQPGCDSEQVQQCVCRNDSFCCNQGWDWQCIMEAQQCGAGCFG